MTAQQNQVSIFLFYAHKDKEWVDQLLGHLQMFEQKGIISIWHDGKIHAGTNRSETINQHLKEASLILLSVSIDLLASEESNEVVNQALKRNKSEQIPVIPILMRPVAWKDMPFTYLEPLPKDRKAISNRNDKEAAFVKIVEHIEQTVKALNRNIASQTANSYDNILPVYPSQQSNRTASRVSDTPISRPERQKQSSITTGVIIMLILAVVIGTGCFWLTHQNRGGINSSSSQTSPSTTAIMTTITPTYSTPAMVLGAQQTLNKFCIDLREGNYSDAYDLLNSYRHKIYPTLDQFKRPWVNLNIKGYNLNSKECIAANFQQLNIDTYTGIITLPRNDNPNPARELVTIDDKDATGIWKVSDWESAPQ